jgi:hypothetical protein
MDQHTTASEQTLLKELGQRRAELRESMSALELALAAAARGDTFRWAAHVQAALAELASDLREHVTMTEGPEGLYQEIIETAPRLSEAMDRLIEEHRVISAAIEDQLATVSSADALGEVDRIRAEGTDLLMTLVRHRQRGADLVYEAYEFDIGGDT